MNFPPRAQPLLGRSPRLAPWQTRTSAWLARNAFWLLAVGCVWAAPSIAQQDSAIAQQDSATAEDTSVAIVEATPADEAAAPKPEAAGEYTPAIKLLPESTAGLVRMPNLPRFCEAFEETHIGRLMEAPAMQPFMEAQRARARDYFESANNKVGLRPQDLYDIVTGEAVFAWLPFEKDKRRPFSVCIVADTRGARDKAEMALAKIDADLIAGGATRKDVTYRDQIVRVYSPKRKPGQLKIEQIAISLSDVRIIAADRDTVVTDLLDAIAGKPNGKSISTLDEFQTVLKRSAKAIEKPLAKGGGALAGEWFARPFQMGRILRETFNVDRGNEVDILKLLEGQGFDAVKGAGGIVAISGERYDILHRGFVLAPPTTKEPSKYELAARMLQFVNTPIEPVPDWIHDGVASYNRLHGRIEEAFWASETLVDKAMGDKIFRPVIQGILEDEEGPQIDIGGDVLPNLDDQIILLTDSTTPIAEDSERMLVAIRVLNANKIKEAVRKWLEAEPDTTKLDVVPGVEIWQVEQSGKADPKFDEEVFGDLGLDFDEQEKPPLLEHWAIALVDAGPATKSPYLLFSSHPEWLIETVKRIRDGKKGGFDQVAEVQAISTAMLDLGGQQPAYDRIVRLRLSLRGKYELLRQGKLKASDSVLAALYRRLFEEEEGEEIDPVNAAKLPPMKAVEQFFPNGGSYFETLEDGWSVTGFILK